MQLLFDAEMATTRGLTLLRLGRTPTQTLDQGLSLEIITIG